MKRIIVISAACVLGSLVSVGEIHGAPLPAAAKLYRLEQGSTFERGCFDPCLCPAGSQTDARGTFLLKLVEHGRLFDTYDVRDVNWTAEFGNNDWHITGSGIYRRGGEVALMERMELDLSVNGEPIEHFDSGWVGAGSDFPAISLTVSIHGMFCFDTVITINSKPVPANQILNYNLTGGATWQQGCFEGCACPLTNEQPLLGTFALVLTQTMGNVREYAMVNVNWKVPAPFNLHIAGAGTYTVVVGFSGEANRMSLDLRTNGGELTQFDSGLHNSTVFFPQIDSRISINGEFCYDTVMQVRASPLATTPSSAGNNAGL